METNTHGVLKCRQIAVQVLVWPRFHPSPEPGWCQERTQAHTVPAPPGRASALASWNQGVPTAWDAGVEIPGGRPSELQPGLITSSADLPACLDFRVPTYDKGCNIIAVLIRCLLVRLWSKHLTSR